MTKTKNTKARRKKAKAQKSGWTIPRIREELLRLAKEHNLPRLAFLARQTKRRFFGRIAKTKQAPITMAVVRSVRRMHKKHPKTHQRDIARLHGIDQGRVNEMLHGFRDGRTYEQHLRKKR